MLHVFRSHEDVDRFFSRLSVAISQFSHYNTVEMKGWGVETIADLYQCLQGATTPGPVVDKLEEVWDWKTYLDPICKYQILNGVMGMRAFKLSLVKR